MQAIILLGGQGTRLRAIYPDRPKALAPINGQPFIARQIEWLVHNDIDDLHMAAGYMADKIQNWLTQSRCAATVTLSSEPSALGTAGGLKFAAPYIRTDPFLVLNGDSLLPNLHFEGMLKVAQKRPTLLTMAVTPIEETGRYGTVAFDAEGRITTFREKTMRASGWVNGGVYLVKKALLDAIEPDKNISLETDIFPKLCAQRQLAVFPSEPPLLDIGTPEGIAAMESFFKSQPPDIQH